MIEHPNAAQPSRSNDEGRPTNPPESVVNASNSGSDGHDAEFHEPPYFEWPALSHAEAQRIQAERAWQEQLRQEEMERAWFEQVMSEAKVQLETDPSFREEVSAFWSKPFSLLANPVRALGRRLSNRPAPPSPVPPSPVPTGYHGENPVYSAPSAPPPKPARSSAPPRLSSPPNVAASRVSSPHVAASPVGVSSSVPCAPPVPAARSSNPPAPRVSSPPADVDVDSLRRSSNPPANPGSVSEPSNLRPRDLPQRRSSLPPEPIVYPRLPTQQSLSPESIAELERYFSSQPAPAPLLARRRVKWSAPLLMSGGAFGISLFVALTWLSTHVMNPSAPAAGPVTHRTQARDTAESNAMNDILVLDTPPLAPRPQPIQEARVVDAVEAVEAEEAEEAEVVAPSRPESASSVARADAARTPPPKVTSDAQPRAAMPVNGERLPVDSMPRVSRTTPLVNDARDQSNASPPTNPLSAAPKLTPAQDTLERNAPAHDAAPTVSSSRRLLAPPASSNQGSGLRVYRSGESSSGH